MKEQEYRNNYHREALGLLLVVLALPAAGFALLATVVIYRWLSGTIEEPLVFGCGKGILDAPGWPAILLVAWGVPAVLLYVAVNLIRRRT